MLLTPQRQEQLDHIRIVLCQTSHPGNIGSTARAMKTMGLSNLYLVQPREFPSAQATTLSSHADDILANAQVVETLDQALAGCDFSYATSARDRTLPWPQLTANEAASQIMSSSTKHIAIVFGNEKTGLSNEQLQKTQAHITIPTNPDYASLNLAQAVQIIAYELFVAAIGDDHATPVAKQEPAKANIGDLSRLYEHLELTAKNIGFTQPHRSQLTLNRFKRILTKADLDQDEVQLLRGFLKKANEHAKTDLS